MERIFPDPQGHFNRLVSQSAPDTVWGIVGWMVHPPKKTGDSVHFFYETSNFRAIEFWPIPKWLCSTQSLVGSGNVSAGVKRKGPQMVTNATQPWLTSLNWGPNDSRIYLHTKTYIYINMYIYIYTLVKLFLMGTATVQIHLCGSLTWISNHRTLSLIFCQNVNLGVNVTPGTAFNSFKCTS